MEMLQPKLRFPIFKEDWKKNKLKEVTTYVDYRGRAPIKTDTGHFLVTAKNIKKGYIDYNCSKEYVSNSDYLNVMSKGLPEIGDVLFTTEAPMGQVAQVTDKSIALAQRVIKFRGNQDLSNFYLVHYMLSDIFQNKISEKSIGTTVQGISGKELHNIIISFPSLQEQTRIANFLSSIDEKQNLLKEKKALLEDYKKGIMQKIFNQEIRFKDDNGIDFEDWEEKSFKSTLKSIATKKHQIQSSEIFEEGKYPVIDQGKKMVAGFSDNLNNLFNDYPIIVFGDHTTILKYIDFDFIVGADGTKLLKNINNDNLKYLYYNLIYNNVEQEGYKRHFSILSEISLQIPSTNEQIKIANFLSAIDKKIELVSNQIQDTQEYKKGLLQQMFV
jgi:type I restriction enzyme S subunit